MNNNTDKPKKLGFRERHQYDDVFGDTALNTSTIRKGFKKYSVAGAKAEFQHGANVGSRVTLTRVALTGIFALALKKNQNKVYVLIETANSDQILVEGPAKQEARARKFTNNVNAAAQAFA